MSVRYNKKAYKKYREQNASYKLMRGAYRWAKFIHKRGRWVDVYDFAGEDVHSKILILN